MKLLHVDASILGENSVSRQLSAAIVQRLREAHPVTEVTYYDLVAKPIDHLTGPVFAAIQGLSPDAPALQQEALQDFLAADIVVIGAPMYNFTVSSQLKAWIDRIVVRGKTFHYTEKGPEGLAGGKKVIIASTRGGFYGSETPTAFLDHQETHLRGILSFMGITDITFIRAEGVAVGPDQRKTAIEAATAAVTRLAA